MKITSDTKGKITKIIKGTVFDKKAFISELFQNSTRANAKEIHINLNGDLLSFEDDGVGLKDAKDLLTFDSSSWESTNEGFGVGFWSVLSIPDIETISISSLKRRIYLDIDKVLYDLSVDYKEVETLVKGFKVVLKSNYFENNFEEVFKTINNIGKFMTADVYINGELIEKKEIFDEYAPKKYSFSKEYSNKLFSVKLFIGEGLYNNYIFYENRFVCKEGFDYGLTAIIKFKNNAVTLKEPDRREIIKDEKYSIFFEKFYDLKKQFLKEYVKYASENNIDLLKNCETISKYLDVKDYKKFLMIDKSEMKITGLDNLKSELQDTTLTKEQILSILNTPGEGVVWNCTPYEEISDIDYFDDSVQRVNQFTLNSVDNNTQKMIINGDLYEKKTVNFDEDNHDLKNINDDHLDETVNNAIVDESSCKKEELEVNSSTMTTIEKYIGNRKLFWVSVSDVSKYNNEISLAEYYDIEVIKSKNILYDNFFKNKKLPNISEIDKILKLEYEFDNLGSKNNKESNFFLLLEAIRIRYKLEPGIFNIADISCVVEYKQDEEYKRIKTLKNTTKKVEIYGCRCDDKIILDRKAVGLKDFNLNISPENYRLGVHEYKCILRVVNTLAHELAHYIYKTSDNTINHFKFENKLQEEIIEMYLNL